MIINTHDQLKANGGGVAIVPTYTGVRTIHPYGWGIYRVGKDGKAIPTDPNAHWTEYGKKVFPHNRHNGTPAEQKRASLEAAKAWITEQGWHDGEWTRNQARDYVPKEVNDNFPIAKRDK